MPPKPIFGKRLEDHNFKLPSHHVDYLRMIAKEKNISASAALRALITEAIVNSGGQCPTGEFFRSS